MHIVMKCPCGAKLKAPEKLVGREIKCPKCAIKLIVPQPPVAKTSTPAVPTAELIDETTIFPTIQPHVQPLDPLAQPLAQPPQQFQQPPYQQQQHQAPRSSAKKPKRKKTSIPLLAGVAVAAIAIFGGGLWAFFIVQTNKMGEDSTAVYLGGKEVKIGSSSDKYKNQKLPQVSDERAPSEPIPDSEKNSFDTGVKTIDISSRSGSPTNLEYGDLVEKVEPSIVLIKVTSVRGESIGSGFFLDTEGKIVTNYHVVQGAHDMTVETVDGKSTPALGSCVSDAKRDLAIIQIDPSKLNCVPISLASGTPRKGEKVAAFGSPQGFRFSATEGIISSIRAGQEVSDILKEMSSMDIYKRLGYAIDMDWLQTSTAISGGNSGGPLVNMKGEVVGVNTWTHPGGQNLNFASGTEEFVKLFNQRDGELYKLHTLHPKIETRIRRESSQPDQGLGF